MPQNIVIIGPGALGRFLAIRLSKCGSAVTLLDHRSPRAVYLHTHGLTLTHTGEKIHTQVPVVSSWSELPWRPDLVIITVKAPATAAVAKLLEEVEYRGPVLTLQNGLGLLEILARHLPHEQLFAGTTSEGITSEGVAQVHHAGSGVTYLSRLGQAPNTRAFVESLANILSRAGLATKIESSVTTMIWRKALINIAMNALTVLLQVPNGQLWSNKPARALMHQLWSEGWNVARCKGMMFDAEKSWAEVREVCHATAGNYSSMVQDSVQGRQTEIQFLNGAIVREGRLFDLACPYNQIMTNLILGLETAQLTKTSIFGRAKRGRTNQLEFQEPSLNEVQL